MPASKAKKIGEISPWTKSGGLFSPDSVEAVSYSFLIFAASPSLSGQLSAISSSMESVILESLSWYSLISASNSDAGEPRINCKKHLQGTLVSLTTTVPRGQPSGGEARMTRGKYFARTASGKWNSLALRSIRLALGASRRRHGLIFDNRNRIGC